MVSSSTSRDQALLGAADRFRIPSLEQLFSGADYFGVTTASPVQRATCRLADGLPLGDLVGCADVARALGDVSALRARPLELYLVSGSRVGKTLLAAAVACRASQTVDVSKLGPGDEPRIPILSLDKDKAYACYLHLVETLRARPKLRRLISREGRNELGAPAVWLRHPCGREVQVCVAAGKAAGNAVVSYFLAGCIFDEFCKMHGSDEAVVNFDDSRRNALGRLLPGAQLVAIGSPWAPFGPAYQAVMAHHGRPTESLVVVRARGRDLNPSWWTPERIASLPPDVLLTEESAEFRDAEESLVTSIALGRCMREGGDMPPAPGETYVAAMDPATRANAWTLVVATRRKGKRVVVLAREWRPKPGAPLDSAAVLREIASLLAPYGLDWVETDQWATDPLRALARSLPSPLRLIEWPATAGSNADMYLELARLIDLGDVEVPPVESLRQDLQRLRKVTTQAGVRVDLPESSDGRHCDFAPSLARVVRRFVADAPTPPPAPGSSEASDAEQRAAFEAARKKYGSVRAKTPYWKRPGW